MAWNTRTNLRAVERTTQLVVAICRQMEDWRRILRYVDRLEEDAPRLNPRWPVDTRSIAPSRSGPGEARMHAVAPSTARTSRAS